ncbi:hypothetical protein ABZ671_00780 [Micromonospora sp. NPDC006766]|uniref:hypothetical protein n=1 Tax=Micromonospora sp. NPDC006766 TaxID=3154778 RepID=UPI00340AD894
MPGTVDMARWDGVELIRTGRWSISTGQWDASREDLAAAVAAMSCPAIGKPIIKIGHTDTRFTPGDGEPAIGWYENLRVADGGHTLIADQVAPAWLTDVQAAAWPNRSVEGTYNARCGLGHTHPFVLTAVALLGVTPPGVSTLTALHSLDDVKALYGIAAGREPAEGEVRIVAAVGATDDAGDEGEDDPPVHTGAMVALIPTEADAQRLAVEGGEPVDELHVTLAYLGTAADITPADRQDIIAAIAAGIDGMPTVQADAFAVSLFNPGRTDWDPCIVLGMSGSDLDVVHELVLDAVAGVNVPDQHKPWHAHLTLIYTPDSGRITDLIDRTGPVVFDRLRIAFAGEHIDIPLIPPNPDDQWDDDGESVAAGIPGHNQFKHYWTETPEGLAKWADHPHPWTSLYKHLRKHVDPERAKRIASSFFHAVFGFWPGSRKGKNPVGPG